MMIYTVEVERKRRLPDTTDRKALEASLKRAGYHEGVTLTETDIYYSRPDIDYMKTLECLRIRSKNKYAEITYKPASTNQNSHDGITSKVEINVTLASPDESESARRLLEVIGMKELAVVLKHRTTFHLASNDSVSVVIDELVGVGTFVEVEVLADVTEAAQRLLSEIEETLGLNSYPIEEHPYRDLVMA